MSVRGRTISFVFIMLVAVAGCSDAGQHIVAVTPTAAQPEPSDTLASVAVPATETPTLTPALSPTPTSAPDTPTPDPTSTPVPTATATAIPTVTPAPTLPAISFPVQTPGQGATLTRPGDGSAMVFVPAGSFDMGSLPGDDQFGPHPVSLDGFWIDQVPVTNAQFAAFLNHQGNQVVDGYTWMEVEQMANCQVEWVGGVFRPEAGKETHPVVEVSWNGANAYCQWVGGRLPTEAEWEFAARGPEGRVYPWGDEEPTCELAHFGGCGDYTVPVGSLSDAGASWVGARGMAGNVWEWVADNYGPYLLEAQMNPTGPDEGEAKVARGGSFMSAPDTLHTAYRLNGPRTYCQPNFGFRCAASAPGAAATGPGAPTPPAEMSLAEIATSLEGLPLDDFFEESYRYLLLRDPEQMTVLGVADLYGLRNDQLNDLSDAYVRETQELEAAILDLLRAYDREALDPEQQVSYDVYEWYLDDRVRGHEFMYYDYPVHHFLVGYHDDLVRLFTEIQPLEDKEDAEDYVARLSQVDGQVEQLLEGLRLREEAGVMPPAYILQMSKPGVQALTEPAASNPLYTYLRGRVTAMDGLSEDEKQSLLGAAQEEMGSVVRPAFVALDSYLDHMIQAAGDDAGLWQFPKGDAYYRYLLRREASVDITPEEAHQLGLAEVERIQAEMRQVFDALGYPQDASLVELLDRAANDAGYIGAEGAVGKDRVIAAYRSILDELDPELDEVFNIRPRQDLVLVGNPAGCGGGYYMEGSRDGSRPGAFNTGVGCPQVPKYNMPTTAYHEAIPGHHFQMTIAQELDLPSFRNDMFFNGYGEGWALYAEQLAWELGQYEDDPYGNIGRLQLELLRAARVVADTGIHALEWSADEAYAYLAETVGGRWGFETHRYVVLPAQATGYKIGMVKILDLRQEAMDALGEEFDIKEFHRVVLGNGSMPLDVLDRVVQDYIASQKAQ